MTSVVRENKNQTAGVWFAKQSPVSNTATKRKETAVAIASTIFLLVVWELLVRVGVLDSRFFPPPTEILANLFDVENLKYLAVNTLTTVYRVLVGFFSGVLAGILLGLAAGLNPYVRAATAPLTGAIYPIPKIAILPLIILIFGIGDMSLFVVVFIGVFFPVLMNTTAGVQGIDEIYKDVGKNVKASRIRTFTTIALPGAMPGIMTGVKVAWGMALLVIISSEFIAAKSGLGFVIYDSWQTFRVTELWSGLIAISVLGIISYAILQRVEKLLVPWRK